MINKLRPATSGWAVILLGVVALSLAGCGRKGPLDLPPTSTGPNGPMAAAPTDSEAEAASKPSVFNPNYGTDALGSVISTFEVAPDSIPRPHRKALILESVQTIKIAIPNVRT